MRRLVVSAGLVLAVLAAATPAWAHGLGGRSDLPVPTWMVAYGAATVLVLTFAGLASFWSRPRLAGPGTGVDLGATTSGWRRRGLVAGRGVGLALLALLAATGLLGAAETGSNLAPVGVYVVFWVGLHLVCSLAGDLWRVLNPFHTLAYLAERGRRRPPAPYRLGHWPAVGGMAGFVWLELVHPHSADPRVVGFAIAAYAAAVAAASWRWGRAWLDQGECFTVWFGLLGRMAPLGVESGRLRLRAPLRGLAGLEVPPALVAMICLVLGSTTYDGVSRTRLWSDTTSDLGTTALAVAGTVGLAWSVAVVGLVYLGAMKLTARMVSATEAEGEDTSSVLAGTFAHSLVPIAFAYAVAHYFSLLVFEGQAALSLASDPFGLGWNLFGTAGREVDFRVVSTTAVAYVQAGSILAGHVAGVVLAHDRAVGLHPGRDAVRSQYPLLGAMVAYTVAGLLLLMGT